MDAPNREKKVEGAVTETRLTRMVESGSTIEAVGGVAAIVLAIIGLTHLATNIPVSYMLPIAAIVLGAALFLQGGLVAAEYNEILSRFEGGPYAEFGGGLGAETLAGISAIVLGILALFGLDPQNLMSVAAVVLGAGLVMSSGVAMRLNSVKIEISRGSEAAKTVARQAVSAAAFAQILIGLGAIILGVLALVGINPITLSLVAMLGVGVSTLVSGGALIGRMWGLVRSL